jgi:anti-sigma regulatory factor (Ser/Thr protein kinase)
MPGRGTGTPAPAAGTVMSTTPLLPALPTVPGLARDHVKVTLAEWGLGGVADAAELIADEMTANAVNASALVQAAVGLLVIRLCLVTNGETLTIECWDQAPGVPVLRPAPRLAETGRGLAIIDALSGGAWGSQPAIGQVGKCVWATIPVREGPASPHPAPCPVRPAVAREAEEPGGQRA